MKTASKSTATATPALHRNVDFLLFAVTIAIVAFALGLV